MTAAALSPAAARVTVDGRAKAVVIGVVVPLVYLLFGVSWMGFVPLLPEMLKQTGAEPKDGALFITIISMAKSIVPILAGIVAARLGLGKSLRLAGVLILLGGVAPWLHGYAAVVAVRFVFGVGGAVWVTLMGPVVLAALSPSARPVANAVNGVAVNTGVVVAFAVMLPLSKALGFQVALTLASVATGVCLLALAFTGRIGDEGAGAKTASVGDTLKAYGRSLALPTTWILAVAATGPLALYLSLNTFLSAHLQHTLGASLDAGAARAMAAHWLSWMNLWGIPSSFLAGLLLAKVWKDPRPYLVVASVVVPLAVYGALHAETDGARALLFALVGFGMFFPVSPLITTVQKIPGMTVAALGMMLGTMWSVSYVVSAAIPTALGPLAASGISLGTLLTACGLLGITPLAGLLLIRKSA